MWCSMMTPKTSVALCALLAGCGGHGRGKAPAEEEQLLVAALPMPKLVHKVDDADCAYQREFVAKFVELHAPGIKVQKEACYTLKAGQTTPIQDLPEGFGGPSPECKDACSNFAFKVDGPKGPIWPFVFTHLRAKPAGFIMTSITSDAMPFLGTGEVSRTYYDETARDWPTPNLVLIAVTYKATLSTYSPPVSP